jgi:rSAM/selenodomain-associated transferase 1
VNPDLLLVLVKEPSPGQVKTRLAQTIGAKAAAELYRLLSEEVLRRTAPRESEHQRLVFFAPSQARAAMACWLPGETLIAQVEGDLGARMAGAFEEAFRRGARRALLIGTDVPGLSRELLVEGFAALEDHDLVLGPARDGGYYLLGLDRPQPALFRSIAWSTSSVLATTVERAGALGLSVRLLETLGDVDTGPDLRREWGRLAPLLAGREGLRRLGDR